jgi:hypothetical protein
VCGFFDLAAGLGGLAWNLGARGGLLMSDGEVSDAEAEISEEEGAVLLRLATDKAKLEVTIAPRAGALSLVTADGSAPPGGPLEAATCIATLRSEDWGRTLQCPGHLSMWAKDPRDGAGTVRHVAIEGAEGSLLVLTARGAPGAVGHGDEQTGGWLLDGEGGFSAFSEALLSTQYDAQGRQTRVGLELWPDGDDAPPMRAAAIRIGGTGSDGGVAAALLRCSTEGSDGLGSYLIWRA